MLLGVRIEHICFIREGEAFKGIMSKLFGSIA
jgi:hypothetical protein